MVENLMDKEWPDEDYFDDEEKSEFDEWRETDNARRYREYQSYRQCCVLDDFPSFNFASV